MMKLVIDEYYYFIQLGSVTLNRAFMLSTITCFL